MHLTGSHNLYLIITEKYGRGRSAIDIARAAIAGGVDIIQMREKEKGEEENLKTGKELAEMCRKNKVLFIVNDDPYLAKKVKADGVHLGQEDLKKFTIAETRKILGSGNIIGISVASVEEAEKANKEDVDYIAFGPVFCTTVKDTCIGTKDIEKVLKLSKHKVFFIGGINLSNIDELFVKGAENVSLIRAILESDDITRATHDIKSKLVGALNG